MSDAPARLRAVLLGYYFPPMGGAGTQRLASFARDLPALGIDPVVVAASELVPGQDTLAHDASLLDGLPVSVPIVRIPGIAQQTPTRLDRISRGRLVASAADVAWARRATDAAVFAARRHAAQITLVTVSPYTLGLHVGELRRRTRRPVVIDLRDPWSLDGWRSFRTPLQAAFDRWTMRRSLATADAVIANCPAAAAAYRELPGVQPERVVVVPNGWSHRDFDLPVSADDTAGRTTFGIVHVGTLHDPSPPTQPERRPYACATVDRRYRSGRTLLTALGHLLTRRPDLRNRLRVDLYGAVHENHASMIRTLRIGDVVHEHGYVAHDVAVTVARQADALFVPLHGVPEGESALVVPGKLYEALATERPVLAAVPEGDARRLVRLGGADGAVVDPDDASTAADQLERWIDRWNAGDPPRGVHRAALAPFERAALSRRVAAILQAVVAGDLTGLPAEDPWARLAAELSNDDMPVTQAA